MVRSDDAEKLEYLLCAYMRAHPSGVLKRLAGRGEGVRIYARRLKWLASPSLANPRILLPFAFRDWGNINDDHHPHAGHSQA